MTRTQRARFSFELRRAAAILAFSAVGFSIIYALPTLAEAVLIGHVKPAVACGLLGDTTGYLVLFFLGYRRIAPVVYLSSKAIEITLLAMQVISINALLWVTDFFPAVVCTSYLSGLVFFSRKDPFPERPEEAEG